MLCIVWKLELINPLFVCGCVWTRVYRICWLLASSRVYAKLRDE